LVDPNSEILNRLTQNMPKAEALSVEIDRILLDSVQSRKSLISEVQPIPAPPRREPRYDRQQLYKRAWKVPAKKLAEEYGVSVSGIRKACKRLHIPVPGQGYWARRAAGKPVAARPALRKTDAGPR
jgi:hypothetical protein